ncbi:MAG: hypothetical protein K1565_20940 [Candidatus Thiodiazotropha sp. (ex. Lucinisca nassula)]|nr:hypothetical protein [Candidatus Thiodiazotropha sp. (ex. Lucinisca nassula)]
MGNQVKIYDQSDHLEFISLLKNEGIPFRIAHDNQVFYPLEYREKIKELKNSIYGSPNKEKTGITVSSEKGAVIIEYLVTNGVAAEYLLQNNPTVILWPTKENNKANKLVKEVMSENGW